MTADLLGEFLSSGRNATPMMNGNTPWALDYRTTDKIDTRALRAAHPQLAEQFTKTSGAWYLTRGKRN